MNKSKFESEDLTEPYRYLINFLKVVFFGLSIIIGYPHSAYSSTNENKVLQDSEEVSHTEEPNNTSPPLLSNKNKTIEDLSSEDRIIETIKFQTIPYFEINKDGSQSINNILSWLNSTLPKTRQGILYNYLSFKEGDTLLMSQLEQSKEDLECSDITKGSYILYRGYDKSKKNSYLPSHFVKGPLHTPISISFGVGLFAGCVNDNGACAYDYYGAGRGMIALVVSMKQDPNDCPFYIPQNFGAIDQLYYYGEFFHARGKVISDGVDSINGVYTTLEYEDNITDILNAKGHMTKYDLCKGINHHLESRSVEIG